MSSVSAFLAARAAASAAGAASSGAASAAPAAAAAAPKAAKANSLMIVYHIDIVLLSLIALLFLFRLPRFIARLWRASEWTNGHRLSNVPYFKRTVGRRVQFSMAGGPSAGDLSTDESHTIDKEKAFAQRVSGAGAPMVANYPPHVSSCVSIFRPMLKLMHIRLVPGVSYSHIAMMTVWLGTLVYPAFYRTNAFTDPVRFGWIAISQLPFVYAFGTKNNVLGMFLGVGYEKLNFMHRFVGRIVLAATNVHGLGYLYKWLIAATFRESIMAPKNYWGLIGLICIDCLFFFSTEFWRKKAYNIFLGTHISSLSLLIFAASLMLYHYNGCLPWAYACAAVYLFDVLQRVIKTRVSTATIRPLPELGVTRVEIPNINSGWRAGQHVRLRVFSSGMGLLGWSEVHPFTIASVADGPEGLVLMCKKAGGWTGKLYDMAKSSTSEDNGRRVSVMVEGPYGGPGNRIFASFSAAVFVVGGSGITFATSAMQELIQKDLDNQSRLKSIELIWTVQDPSALVPMLPLFVSMIQQSVFTPVRISIFYTRAPTGKFPFKDDFFRSTSLTLSPGRPKLHKLFEETITRTVTPSLSLKGDGEASGLFVGVCGPVGLADSVYADVGKIDSFRRDQVGGVEVHEETFGW